ncbi:MAG TPA: hypothetical protein EYH57_00920 [Sulfurovum sp.]|nr:hypothetical protein [Sulfurovum sp.]
MNKKIDALLNDITALRDELILKANLGQAEAKEELDKLDPILDNLKLKSQKIADVAGDSAQELKVAAELGMDADSKEDLQTALELATDELKKSYEKVKNLL